MADSRVEIPNKSFKPSEVCEIARIQPYVLRSWESEFSDLGVQKTPGGPRVYRKADVERVLRIKQLVFGEGLTISGARKRLEQEAEPGEPDLGLEELEPVVDPGKAQARKAQLDRVKTGLREILSLLGDPSAPGGTLERPFSPSASPRASVADDQSRVAPEQEFSLAPPGGAVDEPENVKVEKPQRRAKKGRG